MTERIQRMAQSVLKKCIYPDPVSITYDTADLMLPDPIMIGKRLSEYLLAQPVAIGEDSRLVGQFRADGTVPSDVFNRTGHKHFREISLAYYLKPIDNLATFEWQHSTIDYADIIENGIVGKLARIEKSIEFHKADRAKVDFLKGCKVFLEGVLAWEEKCAAECRKKAESEQNPVRRDELLEMAEILDWVPHYPARSFREAVQAAYFCFDFLPDSICTPDRYFYKLYKQDRDAGILTEDEAKELLQEFFIRIQSTTALSSPHFTRGGQSHFCVGGYDVNGNEVTSELSWIILKGLMELPLYIPQVSFRWTNKTPRENLYRVMDMERHDPYKRIAFVSDEPRIRAFTEICGLSREVAVNYTMVGCNEPSLQGGIWFGGIEMNPIRALETTLYKRRSEIVGAESFDDFYSVFMRELKSDIDELIRYADGFNIGRSKDMNIMSSVFMDGCIESGVSVTQGGSLALAGFMLIGLVTLLDSLAIINQFVFEEKQVDFATLLDALEADWNGYEELHTQIAKKGRFFGNNYSDTDEVCRRFNRDIFEYVKDKTNVFGFPFLIGNLNGYNQHHTWFGEKTKATPDGRHAGDAITFGLNQLNGNDREGLTALLTSVAGVDETHIWCGPSVTNVNLDAALVRNDDNFAKLVAVIETYFRMGGLHIQFNSVTAEELRAAKREPEKYRSLRVRVSGYSDFFNHLHADFQDNIIARTEIKG